MRSLILLCLVLTGMVSANVGTVVAQDNNYREVSANDAKMNKAIAQARRTFGQFKARLAKPKKGDYATVKVKLKTLSGSYEHIWLEDVKLTKGRIKGNLANDPVDLAQKIGDPVNVPESQLSDWAIFDPQGKLLLGGFTVKVIQSKN